MPNWKKVIVSGSNAVLNNITSSGNISASGTATFNALVAAGLTYPTTDGDDGNIVMTDGAGGLTLQPNTAFFNVKNIHGSTLLKGTPVHATGTTGNTSEVIASSASNASSMPATYVLAEDLNDEEEAAAVPCDLKNLISGPSEVSSCWATLTCASPLDSPTKSNFT